MKTKLSNLLNILNRSQRKKLFFLGCLILIGMFAEIMGVGMIVPFFALILNDNILTEYPHLRSLNDYLGDPEQNNLIAFAILILVLVYVAKNSFLSFLAWRQTSFTFDIIQEFSNRLMRLYLFQPYSFHLNNNSSVLIRNVMQEVDLLATNVISPILILITECLVILGLLILLLYIEPVVVLGAGGMIGIAALIFLVLTKQHVGKWAKLRQHHARFRIQHFQQGIGGAKELKLFGREYGFLEKFNYHNKKWANTAKMHNILLLIPRLWIEVFAITSLLVFAHFLLNKNIEQDEIITKIGVFAAAVLRLLPSTNRVVGSLSSLRFGIPSIDVLNKEFKLPNSLSDTNNSHSISCFKKIEIKSLFFKYPGSFKNVINDVSLAIKRGESIGLIGTTGSGKSTLIDLLLGLLSPDEGIINVDGVNIQKNIRSWQEKIGYVPQSIYLSDDTLRSNIAFGIRDDKVDDFLIKQAVNLAQLEEFVSALDEGLDTYVGEQGVRISGGQRQRIGIARALYHNPDILVLDEATSALDIKTESGVMEAVEALHGKKTIIIVAHRSTTLSHCDHIYRIDGGKIKKEGYQSDR
ncbi:ABC transporter ATP-binding protein/permease [bacterium]|nr:ABC transporter ATP-binding protein/permease [bacterium]